MYFDNAQQPAHSGGAETQSRLRGCCVMVWLMVAFCFMLSFLGPFSALIFAVTIMAGSVIYREMIRIHQLDIATVGAVGDAESQFTTGAGRFQPYLVVDLLPLRRRTIRQNDSLITCEICLEDFRPGDKVAGSPNEQCVHEFHEDCIGEALQRATTCPCCRREYLHPELCQEALAIEDLEFGFGETPNEAPLLDVELSVEPDIEQDIELNIEQDGLRSVVQQETYVKDTTDYSHESSRILSSFQNLEDDYYAEETAQRLQLSPLSVFSLPNSHAESYADDTGQYSIVSSTSLSPFQNNQTDEYVMEGTTRRA